MTITFELSNQIIRRTDCNVLASGSQNYVTAKFDILTEDWTAPITAIFDDYTVVLDEDNQCLVPWEVLANSGKVTVSAFCGNLHTAIAETFQVYPSGYTEGQTPENPTPSVYVQLTQLVREAVDAADSVRQQADAGAFDGKDGDPGPQGGYYTPEATQTDESTITIAFTPSQQDMPPVETVSITLPVGCEAAENTALRGAVIAVTGDSISAQSVNYASIIAQQCGMEYQNVAMGGGNVASGVITEGGGHRPSICDSIESMRSDADIILLSGGVNDQTDLNHDREALGELTADFSTQLDKGTFYGGLEYMLRQAVYKWSNKTILYVLPHRTTNNLYFRDAVFAACKKYGVPVVDLMASTMDFYTLPEYKELYTTNSDGWHPNELGYRAFYVPEVLHAIKEHFRGKGDTISIEDVNRPEIINSNEPEEPPIGDDAYVPDIAGFIRLNGTISTSANYLRTDYIPFSSATELEYNVFLGADPASWALFDENKTWLVSSDDATKTDYWHKGPTGNDIMVGWKKGTLVVSDLLSQYPTARYIVVSTYVYAAYEHIVDINGTDVGWGTDTAYIKLT